MTPKQPLRETTVLVEVESITFNKNAARWLGIWLDSQLNILTQGCQKQKLQKSRLNA